MRNQHFLEEKKKSLKNSQPAPLCYSSGHLVGKSFHHVSQTHSNVFALLCPLFGPATFVQSPLSAATPFFHDKGRREPAGAANWGRQYVLPHLGRPCCSQQPKAVCSSAARVNVCSHRLQSCSLFPKETCYGNRIVPPLPNPATTAQFTAFSEPLHSSATTAGLCSSLSVQISIVFISGLTWNCQTGLNWIISNSHTWGWVETNNVPTEITATPDPDHRLTLQKTFGTQEVPSGHQEAVLCCAVTKHWHRLPWEVLQSPPWWSSKATWARSWAPCSGWRCWRRGWARRTQEIPYVVLRGQTAADH